MSKTKARKLTERQLACLQALAEDGAVAHYTPYAGRFNPNAYWYLEKGHAQCTAQVRKLIDLGLLDRNSDGNFSRGTTATINDAGRAYLAEHGAPKKEHETWWSLGRWSKKPEQAVFASSTDSTLIELSGRRRNKHSEFEHWYPTREAAIAALRKQLKNQVRSTKASHDEAVKDLAAFNKREGGDA